MDGYKIIDYFNNIMLRLVAKYPRIRRNGSFTLVVSGDEPYLSHRQNQGELTY